MGQEGQKLSALFFVHSCAIDPVHLHLSRHRQKAAQTMEQSALAAAIEPQQGTELTGLERKINAMQYLTAPIGHADMI